MQRLSLQRSASEFTVGLFQAIALLAGCEQRTACKMSASARDAHAHTAAFSSRAAAVFGALSAGTGQPAWSLSRETVFKAGKAADYSSDEEVQATVAEKWREETLPSDLLDLAGQRLYL